MFVQNAQPAARRLGLLACLITLLAFAPAPWGNAPETAQAGPPDAAVLDWNLHAIDTLVNAPAAATPGAGQPPPVSIQHLAMVQGAVYDAVNLIDGGHEAYLAGLSPASPSASKAAAVATAAHDVLVGVVVVPPLSQAIIDRLDDLRDDSIAAATTQDGQPAVDAGIAAGQAAADAMLEARENDGRYGSFRFTTGVDPGEWATTPPGFVNDPFAWVARVEPFLLESTSQFRTKGPHALSSGAYAKEYNEVKELGGDGTTTPTLRTPEQTALARFYAVNPVEMFNRTFRAISEAEGLTLVEEARLFAMLNMGGADALINCWDDKAFWSFWRPITAIRNGDNDGNDKTVGDPQWTSLIPSPPYPDHPSGYNCVTSSFMHTAEAFFGKSKMPFSVTAFIGNPPAPITRDYERFTDVVDDTIDARMFLGIHFRTPDEQGAGIGRDVAHWLDKNFFQPVKD
jgi:hypothetical protein